MYALDLEKEAKIGFAVLKLDMSKTYNRVEWIFLQEMMLKLGFAKQWVNLVTRCVTLVSYSIQIISIFLVPFIHRGAKTK